MSLLQTIAFGGEKRRKREIEAFQTLCLNEILGPQWPSSIKKRAEVIRWKFLEDVPRNIKQKYQAVYLKAEKKTEMEFVIFTQRWTVVYIQDCKTLGFLLRFSSCNAELISEEGF